MSCLSTATYERPKVNIPFDGPMDTRFGYENIPWGTSYKKIKDDGVYPIGVFKYKESDEKYFLGYTEKSDGTYYVHYRAHGDVDITLFYFTPDTKLLYQVAEVLITKNPSLEYLHSRYGDFNEKNVASESFKAKGGVAYTNAGCIEGSNFYTLLITIDSTGKTTVTVTDPFASITVYKSPVWDSKFTNIQNDTWYCWASINGKSKAIDYTFVQKNADNKWLVFGYWKSLESPALSYVRAGLGWGDYSNGIYEIKLDKDIISYDFSSQSWDCGIIDVRFWHTGGEYRKITDAFLRGEKFTVRHKDKITEFNSAGFSELLESKGISADEIDFAIANEEF